MALRLRDRALTTWPIMPGSERQPEGWPGWPDGKKFALVLTHDVEGRLGLNKCQQLAQLEREMGFRSSFNFIPEGDYRVSPELREKLVRDGFEVGVHDLKHDGRLYQSRRDFSQKAVRINKYLDEWGASGFRSGFMLHNLNWLHDLGIKYDMSTFDTDPFEPQPDGRHTIFPFIVPRPQKRNGHSPADDHGYVELPYTLPQDSTLFLLLREETVDIWLRKLDWIAKHGGMVLLDTHPDYMAFGGSRPKAMEYPVGLYEQFLDYIRSNYSGRYWHALPKEIAARVLETNNLTSGSSLAAGLEVAPDREQTISLSRSIIAPNGGNRQPQPRSSTSASAGRVFSAFDGIERLRGKRGAVLLFSHYPDDPRPRRAAEALTREGVTIDLICLQQNRNELRRQNINGVNVLRLPLKRHRGGRMSYISRYSGFILTSFAYLASRSLSRRYDFVHIHNMPDILVFSALVPKALGAKIILDLHDPMPELMQTIFGLPERSLSVRILKRMEKRSIAFADAVLTVNLACKKIYSSRSCSPEKINVVLNSPDDTIFRFRAPAYGPNGTRDSKSFVILYHGSLVLRNGFDLAVDALETARRTVPQARLVVCGARTPFFETVMESARERGLEKSIDYLGVREVEQIVEAIDRCDLGIIPNHRNIFTEINTPTRIFEYLALGKPVIAPRARGIQDYFGDEDLIYFELGDAADLAKKIEFVFFHPGEAKQIVKRGQQIYLAHTWSLEKSTLLRTIGELL